VARNIKRVGELLKDFDYITEEQFQKALEKQQNVNGNTKLGEVLIDMGFVTEDELIQVLEFQMGIPHADLGILSRPGSGSVYSGEYCPAASDRSPGKRWQHPQGGNG